MLPLHLPRVFERYACERSLVCCKHPVRAPVPEPERARMLSMLGGTVAGRTIAVTLADRIHEAWQGSSVSVWRQREGRCINLADAANACVLHEAAGLEALPSSCRNFPRWVTALPDRIEAAFALTCPTAARMLATDSTPWSMSIDAHASWPYHPTTELGDTVAWKGLETAPLADALALRQGWWDALATTRSDPRALAGVLARMLARPLEPGLGPGSGSTHDATPETTLDVGVAQTALSALERLPDRDAYQSIRWDAFAELSQPMSVGTFMQAMEPAPECVAAFASHGVQWVGVHDPRPAHEVVQLVARRTVLVVRLVEALCARVPYPLKWLLRDAFSAASYVDA